MGRVLRILVTPRWEWLVLPAVGWLAVAYGYPVLSSVISSVTSFVPPERRYLDNFIWFFTTPVNLIVLERTVIVALIVTAACLFIGFPYAYLLTSVGRRTRLVMLAAVLVPFWTSLLVRSFAWIALLGRDGPINDALTVLHLPKVELIGTAGGVTLAMTQILLPFMVLPLYGVLRNVDRRLMPAAASLGARPLSAFLHVYLPLSLPGIVAGSSLVFVLSLGFFVTPSLLGSPQDSLISQLIVTQTNTLLAFGRAGAMSVVLLVVTLGMMWMASRVVRHSSAYRHGLPAGSRW